MSTNNPLVGGQTVTAQANGVSGRIEPREPRAWAEVTEFKGRWRCPTISVLPDHRLLGTLWKDHPPEKNTANLKCAI